MDIEWKLIESKDTPDFFYLCPYCNKEVLFLPLNNFQDASFDVSEFTDDAANSTYIGLRRCSNPSCKQILAFQFTFIANLESICEHTGEHTYWEDIVEIETIPRVNNCTSINHAPKDIEESFNEAQKCFYNECYIASAIMIRKTLELLCGHNKITGKSLEIRINKLIEVNPLFKELGADLHVLRELGNDGAHIKLKNFNSVSKKEVKLALEAIKYILVISYEAKGDYKASIDKLKRYRKKESN